MRRVRRATAQTGRDSRSFKPYYSHSTRTIRTTVASFFSFSILASFGHLIAAVLLGPVQSCVHSLFELFTALAALKFCNPDTHRQRPSIWLHTGVFNSFANAFRQSSGVMKAHQRQQADKFITAETRDSVRLSACAVQNLGEIAQNGVARVMAEAIIDVADSTCKCNTLKVE